MVDLVKIRQKAKERKQESDRVIQEAVSSLEPAPAEESSPAETAGKRKPVRAGGKMPEETRKKQLAPHRAESLANEPARQGGPAVLETAGQSTRLTSRPSAVQDPVRSEKLERFKETAGKAVVREAQVSTAVAETEVKPFLELLTFVLSGETYAVEIERIVEIIQPRSATPIPNAGDLILGIVSLRGTIVTILDLRRRLGHPIQSRPGEGSKIVVVESAGETAGFLVDRVLRVVKLDASLVGPPPVVVSGEQNEFIRGVFQQAQKLVILLDLNKILGS